MIPFGRHKESSNSLFWKLTNERKQVFILSFIKTAFQVNQMVNTTEFHFVECLSINVEEITELESHYYNP